MGADISEKRRAIKDEISIRLTGTM